MYLNASTGKVQNVLLPLELGWRKGGIRLSWAVPLAAPRRPTSAVMTKYSM